MTTQTTKTKTTTTILMLAAFAALASCVDHRPLRTEVFDENVYLEKSFLTRENPNRPGENDYAWLYVATIVKQSAPDPGLLTVGDYSRPRYARFQFDNDRMEMVDDAEYAPAVTNTDGTTVSPSLAKTVLNSWPGTHVDIQMKDNLDGERTNVIEENRERPWKERQQFKIDFTKATVPDINMIGWYLDDDLRGCLNPRSVSLVPDSVEIEKNASKTGSDRGDDYMSWTLAVTYEYALIDGRYYCGNMITSAAGRTTFTYHIKYSFWRPPKSDYKAVELKEKDPIRLKVGAWETGGWNAAQAFLDPKTDLPGMRSYLVRFDPTKKHTFYFTPAVPERYKDHMRTEVAKQVNELMSANGAAFQVEFKDWNDGGKNRTFGDIRYSMITYHNMPAAGGPIGMAYINSDPRTGETLSGGFNMYDWIDNVYLFQLQDYLKEVTGDTFDDTKSTLPKTCKPGDKVPIDQKSITEKHKNTSLYAKLEAYMKEPAEKWVPEHTPEFGTYMRALLPDLRFSYPPWNSYVQSTAHRVRTNLPAMRATEEAFQKSMASIDRGESPFGGQTVLTDKQSIAAAVASLKASKEQIRNHFALKRHEQWVRGVRMADIVEGGELGPAMARSSRMCKQNGTWETRDEWAQRIIDNWFKVFATHEFGHTLSLRHNFYGSMDLPHMNKGDVTSSIMDYEFTYAEAGDTLLFKPWDLMSLKWIYAGKEPAKTENWLYCTDEHVYLSPFCTQHDVGTTPTELVKNEIDYYEWQYKFRNFRAYRKFWDNGSYGDRVLSSVYPLRRFLNLWGLDWSNENIKNDLILVGAADPKTCDAKCFTAITDEFNDEMGRANRLIVNFYKAILQQSSGERTYATKFDTFYGDVTQQGIILDKYFAMLLHVGLWPADDYDFNVYAYFSYHEVSHGNPTFYSDAQDVTSSMIGGEYDVYPWFKPTAVLLFAQDTHDVMFGDNAKQKWIEMRRYDRVQDMIDVFGFDPRIEALKADNPYQTFNDKQGNKWVYYYMADRNKHLCASKNWNPIAYKILWDQNERLNIKKYSWVDDYEIKYYLDFYEYFN